MAPIAVTKDKSDNMTVVNPLYWARYLFRLQPHLEDGSKWMNRIT